MSTLNWPASARNVDALGIEQKKYESMRLERMMPMIPIIARLDGKAFHTFTKGLNRPFDINLQLCMQNTMLVLSEKFNVDLAYTQSDEISLVWYNTKPEKIIFDGRSDKYTSLLAATAAVAFYKELLKFLPTKVNEVPIFDCRVFQVPNQQIVFENIVWRWMDARKNSVSMLASSHFSDKDLHGKSTKQRKEMLCDIGVYWDNLTDACKTGTFCKRTEYLKHVSEESKEFIKDPIVINGEVFVYRKRYDFVFPPSLYCINLINTTLTSEVISNDLQNKVDSIETIFSENILRM